MRAKSARPHQCIVRSGWRWIHDDGGAELRPRRMANAFRIGRSIRLRGRAAGAVSLTPEFFVAVLGADNVFRYRNTRPRYFQSARPRISIVRPYSGVPLSLGVGNNQRTIAVSG